LFRSPRAISWAATIVTICPLLTLFRVSPVFITILLSPGGLGFTAPVVSPPQLFILPSDSFQPLPVSGSPDHIYFVVFIVLAFTHLVPSFFNPFIKLYASRSEEHTSELQSRENLVCRLLLETTKMQTHVRYTSMLKQT